jgi:hypothetical protein
MAYSWAASAVVAFHFAFIAFVICGGALVLRDMRWAWIHVPAVVWVVWLELTGTICPLTPLENTLRNLAGDRGYSGGFIDHYLTPIIYPPGLTPQIQVALGLAVLAVNAAVYLRAWRRRGRSS